MTVGRVRGLSCERQMDVTTVACVVWFVVGGSWVGDAAVDGGSFVDVRVNGGQNGIQIFPVIFIGCGTRGLRGGSGGDKGAMQRGAGFVSAC